MGKQATPAGAALVAVTYACSEQAAEGRGFGGGMEGCDCCVELATGVMCAQET